MRALRYHADPLRYLAAGALGKRAPLALAPLRLERVPVPEPPPGWRRVTVRLAGVCGSDLGLLFGKNSPRLSGFFSFPAVLGHEVVGEVEGTRVVVNPLVSCQERGLAPCDACARGDDHLCAHVADGTVAPGSIGYNRDLPGGWGEELVAAEPRLHAVPDAVPDERAVLAEPFAVALRGARIALAGGVPRHVLVIGAGSIGLLTVAALRRAGYAGAVHVVARYPQQADAARSLGADAVHGDAAAASDVVGGRAFASVIGPPGRRGGFDVVLDAAGSPSSLDAATWSAREGGRVVLLGAPGTHRHDFSPHWFREVALLGSYVYTATEFGEATDALDGLDGLERIVTHRYPLERYREALRDVRRRRALKAVFAPSG
jgi:threonine dehydrogenase-like Zn-dependent dehydrogenase